VRQLWPSYHSPLLWDLTAILTYLTCSILFAYVSLIPDIAMMRDHTTGRWQQFYRLFALGWRGTESQWVNIETSQNVFSYGIIPVMFSVHTIVSWDFAMALQPGWHSTVFGPYFVVGALFSGAGAVIIALILLRSTMNLKYFLRPEHFNGMAMFLLVLSLTWDYFYFNDYLAPWYGGAPVDRTLNTLLQHGAYAPFWYTMIFCNTIVPALTLWSKKIRTNLPVLFCIALLVNVGMYLERVIIVPLTLARNELPFSWGVYTLQLPETMITIGTFCFLFLAYLTFTRIFPIIPLWEVYEGQALHGLHKVGRYLFHHKSAE
jgi:molybdopterin-containing oxidoreductase family membrane subunit